ncbi:MAG: RNA-binding cell elongation regulator Jag/EloR, partial [Oscillospiraceae bacterium]
MSYIDVTAKNEEEAVAKALAQLSLDRDDVSVQILERAKTGFLGLGSAPAKVRVTYEGYEAPKVLVEEVKPEPKPVVVPPKPAPKPAAPRPAAPRPAARPAPSMQEEPEDETVPFVPAHRGEEVSGEKPDQIRAFLTGLLAQLESTAEIQIYQPEPDRYKVYLEGEQLGALIGRRGETLDALQQLTGYAVNRGASHRVRIHLDAENYREKREQSLERLAVKVAGKVVKYRRSVTLEPMNAYERH